MNKNLSIFQFESKEIRVVLINDEPWFVAKDVCEILELEQVSRALSRLDEDEKRLFKVTPSESQQMNIVSESGLYTLILSSRKPETKPFKKWVTSEVLPQIRKVGSYSIKQLSPAELILAQAQQLVDIEHKQLQLERQLSLESQRTDSLESLVTQHDAELDRIFNANGHYYSIMGYCSLFGKPIAVSEASALGRRATKLCKENGYSVVPISDPRFGKVNSYPEVVLSQII